MTTEVSKPKTAAMRSYQNFINGKWVSPISGQIYERKSPVTGQTIVQIPWSDQADADTAIQAARQAFDRGNWSKSHAYTRHDVLGKIAQALRVKASELAQTLCEEVGRPLEICLGEVQITAQVYDYFAGLALDVKGESITQHDSSAIGLTIHEPVGVVGIITPWNFPLLLVSWKIAPALAAGCTMVVKPSEFTPSSTFMLAEIIAQAGVPEGVINIVTGDGPVVGERLVESPLVDKIAFTGSTAIGRRIMAKAAPTLKRISLELGGKSPNIVFPDADLAAAVGGAFFGIYLNSGQVCQAGSRLLLHESIKDEFVEQLVAATKNIKLGDPMDSTTTMGPVINEKQFDRIQGYIQAGQTDGAKMLIGGSGRYSVEGLEQGLFVQPTIFDAVNGEMAIAREEIFGPVLSVISFKDEADALQIANNSMYGLTAAVWTKNLDTAMRMAKGIRVGTVWVNTYHTAGLEPCMPYGGYKQSGIGRELGHKGLEEYFETKSIQIKLGN
ncbi:MAG: Betaine aldehyde dehydrogenase [Chroococcidiopsis cubana SAG 39.79]|uniref:aldehyde dehydrogenase family protein n=1 Tax=Chroococcidiopsis cubana TaxID=171392 RepID=UPI002AC5C89C|nr:aldehyde dehydrogenase family protein [Chroococcidiopsis cubana]MDZ4877099.1 Betaine aldehyde dehydrogenase [Chroococcidiopsis cubana SAG 39.79]